MLRVLWSRHKFRRELNKHKVTHHEDDVGALGALEGPLAVGELWVVAAAVVLVARTLHLGNTTSEGQDFWLHERQQQASEECEQKEDVDML